MGSSKLRSSSSGLASLVSKSVVLTINASSPSRLTMTLAQPSDFVETYTAVLAVIAAKCVDVNSSQTQLHSACTKLKQGIVNLKEFVKPLNEILPVENDLTDLQTLSSLDNLSWQEEVRIGAEMLIQVEKNHPHNFPEDDFQGSIFSPLRMAELQKFSLKANQLKKDPFLYTMEVNFNSLAQVRGMRLQMQEYFSSLRWVLVASLMPQFILLLLLCINFVLNKRKQSKLRKKIKKAQESRELMGRMRNIATRDQDRFIEI